MTTEAVTCLVLVDLQAAFVTGPGAVDLPAAATDLLDRARQRRSLIIHLQNDGPPGAADAPATPGWALHLTPEADEKVIRKVTDDGFEGTGLSDFLTAGCIRRLAITGVMSEMWVSATARSALQRGIAVVLAHGAHTTYDIAALPAATVARVAEWALGDQLELPATSKDIMFTTADHRPDSWRTQRRWLRPGLVRQTGTRDPRTCWSQCRPSPETRIVSQLGSYGEFGHHHCSPSLPPSRKVNRLRSSRS